ncbi:MAG TPA: glycogen/starch synthase [Longimicrobiales bacterium]|nr:glycogen/starch synthase [Longimicrobiales bacterium]
MRILIAASEAVPYFKTGGLADVAGALADALAAGGHDVLLALPRYTSMNTAAVAAGDTTVPWPGGRRQVAIFEETRPSGARAAFLAAEEFFATDRPYEPPPGEPLGLGRRFAFFSRTVAALSRAWQADVIHLNDWQTGLVPVYGLVDGTEAATVFAVHNLAYQGNFPRPVLRQTGVPDEFFRTENGLEFYGQASFMKAGIAIADRLVTVSPTYASEIQTPAYGAGLHGLLSFRRRTLHGVLNGIDMAAWNPVTDPLIPARYSARTPGAKADNRTALLRRTGIDGDGPVLGMVTRIAHQKGIDILLAALPGLVRRGCSLVLLGDGDRGFLHALESVASEWPDRVTIVEGFDEPLAHLIYAGADYFLMPSLYEPCGLGQMIAQRYGTPPIARRTGGLNDTITDGSTGFLFEDPTPDALLDAVDRAAGRWRRRGWRAMQVRCMRLDNSWARSAREYEHIYRLAMGSLAP